MKHCFSRRAVPAPRATRHCHFMPAGARARQQQVGHIRTADEEHSADCAQKHHERRAGAACRDIRQRLDGRRPTRVASRLLQFQLRREGGQLGPGVKHRRAWRKTSNALVVANLPLARADWSKERQIRPGIRALGKRKPARHDSDDLARHTALNANGLADRVWRSTEDTLPQGVADHHLALVSERFVLICLRPERPAEDWTDSQERKQRRRHIGCRDDLLLLAQRPQVLAAGVNRYSLRAYDSGRASPRTSRERRLHAGCPAPGCLHTARRADSAPRTAAASAVLHTRPRRPPYSRRYPRPTSALRQSRTRGSWRDRGQRSEDRSALLFRLCCEARSHSQ